MEMFAVIFGAGKICKFINRTFDFYSPPLYNISAKEVYTMTDTLFEQLGGTYTQIGDYLLPDLSLPAEKDDRPIGIWGQRRLRYLKQYHIVTIDNKYFSILN